MNALIPIQHMRHGRREQKGEFSTCIVVRVPIFSQRVPFTAVKTKAKLGSITVYKYPHMKALEACSSS